MIVTALVILAMVLLVLWLFGFFHFAIYPLMGAYLRVGPVSLAYYRGGHSCTGPYKHQWDFQYFGKTTPMFFTTSPIRSAYLAWRSRVRA